MGDRNSRVLMAVAARISRRGDMPIRVHRNTIKVLFRLLGLRWDLGQDDFREIDALALDALRHLAGARLSSTPTHVAEPCCSEYITGSRCPACPDRPATPVKEREGRGAWSVAAQIARTAGGLQNDQGRTKLCEHIATCIEDAGKRALAEHRAGPTLPTREEIAEAARLFTRSVYDQLGKGRLGHATAWEEMHQRFKDQLYPLALKALSQPRGEGISAEEGE